MDRLAEMTECLNALYKQAADELASRYRGLFARVCVEMNRENQRDYLVFDGADSRLFHEVEHHNVVKPARTPINCAPRAFRIKAASYLPALQKVLVESQVRTTKELAEAIDELTRFVEDVG